MVNRLVRQTDKQALDLFKMEKYVAMMSYNSCPEVGENNWYYTDEEFGWDFWHCSDTSRRNYDDDEWYSREYLT